MKIVELRLQTEDLDAQREFYSDVLQLRLLEATSRRVAFQTGGTRLGFELAPAGWSDVYHFAFNTPENQLQEARAWLTSRVAEANRELVLSGSRRQRVRMPVDFPREPGA